MANAAPSDLDKSIDAQQFKPLPGRFDVLGAASPRTPALGAWNAGVVLHFAHRPFRLVDPDTGEHIASLIGHQFQADFVGSFVLVEHLELGLAIPFILHQGEGSADGVFAPPPLSSTGIGDIRLVPRYTLIDEERVGLAAGLTLALPTGMKQNYGGHGGVTVSPLVSADYRFADFTVNGHVGVALRGPSRFLNVTQGHAFTFGLGGEVPFTLMDESLAGIATLGGEVGLVETQAEEIPLELLVGARWYTGDGFVVTLGGGPGLTRGAGTPTFRVFTGVGMAFDPPPPDADGDGIIGDADACPNAAEDKDGWEDEDGCPELDNDQDGLNDDVDQCKNDPEDIDTFEDKDGCPDPDNDGDGILDAKDTCPLKAEDPDGFDDGDGCPELDNDGDGIVDTEDTCPLKAEDPDGFEDTDGCPDPDNDEDGILDEADSCPTQAEDMDGIADDDGCPEVDADKDGIADTEDKCPMEPEVINGFEDEDGCPDEGESRVKVDEATKKIVILDKVYFAKGKDLILKNSFNILDQVYATIRANPQIERLRIEGYTDSDGNDQYNKRLSQKRAEAVRRYLIKKGIVPERLDALGYGEEQPLVPNDSKDNKAKNRRVEFTILEDDK